VPQRQSTEFNVPLNTEEVIWRQGIVVQIRNKWTRSDLQASWATVYGCEHKLTFSCRWEHASLKLWIAHMQWMPIISCDFHWNRTFSLSCTSSATT